jgi:hypothetical protein
MTDAIKIVKKYNEIAPMVSYLTEKVKEKKLRYLANSNNLLGDLRVSDTLDGTAECTIIERNHYEGKYHIILECTIKHSIVCKHKSTWLATLTAVLFIMGLTASALYYLQWSITERTLLEVGCKVYTKYGAIQAVEIDGESYLAGKKYPQNQIPFVHQNIDPSECRYIRLQE